MILHVFDSFLSSFNKFGIAHEYRHRPSYDPEHCVPAEELSNPTDDDGNTLGPNIRPKSPPWPWSNISTWRLMSWQLTGNDQKSSAETTRLVHDMLLAYDFKLEDLSALNAETAIKKMDKSEAALAHSSQSTDAREWDGWKTEVNVDIEVPSHEKCSEANGRTFTVHGLTYRCESKCGFGSEQ